MNNNQDEVLFSLEKLNEHSAKSSKNENFSLNLYSSLVPEMEFFERLSKFRFTEFQFAWSLLIFLSSFYNFFTAGYCLGMNKSLEGAWLGVELLTEALIFIDLCLKIFLCKSKHIWFIYESQQVGVWLLLTLSSVPYSVIFTMTGLLENEILIGLRFLKLLRIRQMWNFMKNFEMVVWEKSNNLVNVIEGVIAVVLASHYSGMVWLINKRDSGELEGSDEFAMYVNAVFWATETLTGIVQSKTEENDEKNRFLTINIMVVGGLLYGLLFVQIFTYLNKARSSYSQHISLSQTFEHWCEKRTISPALKKRIFSYLEILKTPELQSLSFQYPSDLPISLLSELSLFKYKDLISKVKLFELGEPSFVMSMARSFSTKIFLQGDYIIRLGDLANNMYFINKGLIEVLATDNHSRIALLEEGNYFGEIGILFNCCRTVSIRTITLTIVANIEKDQLLGILSRFPEHEKFLKKVASQRIKTCHKEDIDLNYDIVEDNYSSSDSDHSGELECPQYYAPAEHKLKPWWLRFITVAKSKARKGEIQIDPLSSFHYLWSYLLILTYTLYLFIIPYSIEFKPETELLIIDSICYGVFVVDVFVNYHSALLTKYRSYVHDQQTIQKNYMDQHFIFDALAVVPADWVYCIFHFNSVETYYLKLLRFFKLSRVLKVFTVLKTHSNLSDKLIKLVTYIYIFCTLGHLAACIEDYFEGSQEPRTYIEDLFWSFSVLSQSSYGNITLTSLSSKVFFIFLMVFSKVFYLFLLVDSLILIKENTQAFLEFVKKLKIAEEWMNHCKIPLALKLKVREFYKFKWEQLRGIEDQTIFNTLPESISTDLRLFLFSGIIESGFFPSDEKGAILGIIRKCKLIMITQGLNVINKDELGFEMFFIIEGQVTIDTGNETLFKVLGPGSVFGEVAIIEEVPGFRMATVSAKTNLTLASLSVADFKEVARHYTDFEKKVRKLAQDRKKQFFSTDLEENSVVHYNSYAGDPENNFKMMSKPEENSIEKTVLTTNVFESKSSSFGPVEFRPLALRLHQKEVKYWVYLLFWSWNVMFVPLQVAFGIEYSSLLMFIEVLSATFYASISLFHVMVYNLQSRGARHSGGSKNNVVLYCVYNAIIAFPAAMIIEILKINDFKVLTTISSYIRVSNYPFIFIFFSKLKEKNINWYVFIQLTEILMVCFTFSHITACLFITIGYNSTPSFINSLEADNELSIYLSSFYWAFGTLIHMLQGDVKSVSQAEILFNCLIQLISLFFYAVLFGSFISIITVFGSKLRDKFYSDYSYTMTFIKQKQVLKYKFMLNNYFNFIWENSRGALENEAIEGLPESLKADLFIANYLEVLKSSEILRLGSSLNVSLIRSLYSLINVRYSLLGDVILRIDDLNSYMYFILSGEVTVISIEGNQILKVLYPGDHFGELSIVFDTFIRTATVVATKTSELFYLSSENLLILFAAYPEFKEKLTKIGEQRLKSTFKATTLFEVSEICEKFTQDFDYNSPINRKYTKQAELLISHQVADARAAMVIDKKLTLNGLHLLLTIYSCIMIPIEIAFFDQYPTWILAIELFCFLESAVYLFSRIKYELNLKVSEIFSGHSGVYYDFAAISPLNFVFPLIRLNSPAGLISTIRCIRLLSVFRIHSLLSYLIVYNKRLFLWVTAIEAGLILFISVNWITCIIHFNYSCSANQHYLSALYLTMNLLTSTGHTDAYPCNDTLTFQVCIIGFISIILLSVLYSVISFLISKLPQKTLTYYTELTSKFAKISENQIPATLKYKIESYAKFSTSLHSSYGETIVTQIYSHLPTNIVHELIHEKLKHILKKVPIFKSQNSSILMQKIALSLQPEIYLPSDYLIYKNDIGEEMYFIAIGSVNIISPDNTKVLKTLFNGDFVGEMALIRNSRRMCSVVASTLCLVYSLKKKDFYETLKNFPQVLEKLKQESENRSREMTSVSKSGKVELDSEDEEQEKLFNHLRMFSLMSSSLADEGKNRNNASLLTGMKNIRAETSVDTFVKDLSQNRLFKRRPNVENKGKRRKSLESLGKNLVFERFSKLKMKWTSKE